MRLSSRFNFAISLGFTLLVVAGASFEDKPLQGDMLKLQGAWTGKFGAGKYRYDVRMEISGNKVRLSMTSLTEPKSTSITTSEFEVFEDTLPHRFWNFKNGRTENGQRIEDGKAIYKIEGDTLTLCNNRLMESRPIEFKDPVAGPPRLMVLRREVARDSISEINKPFEKPDVDEFVKRFESESREVFTKREAIVKTLEIKSGMSIADVGAGTGLFTKLFADAVGREGRVFAVDISRPFLKHIEDEAKRLGHKHVRAVLGSQDSVELPESSVDLVFLCDTYHHFEKPEANLASIRKALKPGGSLVVIDFDRREGVSQEFVLKHVRASRDVFVKEIESAGFQRMTPSESLKLRDNFLERFRKR